MMRIAAVLALLASLVTTALPAATPAKKPVVVKAVAKPAPKPAPKPVAAKPVSLPDTPEVQALRRAFRFAFPVYEMLRTRQLQLGRAEAAGFPNANNILLPRLTLSDANARDITTPNNDTLYGSAWLDLRGGPVVLSVPNLPGRYNSAALMSLSTDVVALIGTRTAPQGGRYTIAGPDYAGETPAGTEMLRCPTNICWLLVRVLVNGPEDVAAAAQGVMAYSLSGPRTEALAVVAPPNPDAATFLKAVNAGIALSGSASLQARAAGFADTGLGAEFAALTPEQQKLWESCLPLLVNELKGGLADMGTSADGWSYPPFNMAEYGDDDDLRAKVALGGLAALPRVEALYLTARADATGKGFDGSKSYRVRLPGGMPVGGFWSLTMYQQEADGRLFFVPNRLNRWAVGDRSKHLRYDRDGSFEIFVQAAEPAGERVVNWLPAPKGKFVLIFRAYLPKTAFLDGTFRLPPVVEGELIPAEGAPE
jgi:hypothetical protein